MSDLQAIRREIAEELASALVGPRTEDYDQVDRALGLLSRDWQPSPLAIEALIADALPLDFPSGHVERDRQRRQTVLSAARASTPTIGSLLRSGRGATPARAVAERAGVATSVWELIEEDRAPAAVLNLDPRRLRNVADDLGVAATAIAASLERSLADAATSQFAFGYRPRQPVEEGEPLSFEATDQNDRVWSWLLEFLSATA